MNNKLRNLLIGAGIAAVGGIAAKKAVDYFRNRDQEEPAPEDQEAVATAADEVAYVSVAQDAVQGFLDASFGDPGRYVPNRPPKVFDYQEQQYMVIWAYDNQKNKNQMMAFQYTDGGRQMVASVGYTADATDYNINLSSTPFAVEVNGQKITSGQAETDGANDVDFVLAA
jgi:hypothetical protein